LVPNTDSDPDFSDEFCRFLQNAVTNVDAAELLLCLYDQQQRSWPTRELRAKLAPVANLSEADVERYVGVFQACSLVKREADQSVQYRRSPSHDGHVAMLARLYVERPVTLFRLIYALRDSKIHTFADAFNLRR
jgi:hypothetical protein